MTKLWQDIHSEKLQSASAAISHISNGQTVFIGSGAGEPLALTQTLAEMAPRFSGVELIHLTAVDAEARLASPELAGYFRYNTFYTGRGVSDPEASSSADYTPIDLSDLPRAMAEGTVQIDVALIQVSPPDQYGLCSLGVAVDVTKAALENASLVIAQVNEYMPVTMGNSVVPLEQIDLLVEANVPLPDVRSPELDPVSLTIGRLIASLINDDMTLHFDRGALSAAAMRYLDTKNNLGIHTDILTDDMLRLCKSGAVNNRKKNIHSGKTVATMAMGSQELYQALHTNPHFELLPIEQINDPFIIAQNDNMVSIHSIQEIELTGLARVDTQILSHGYDLPSSMDFITGSSRSKHGFSILALPSTTSDGKHSRIVPHSTSRGVAFSRSKANYIVTEYGIVNLWGRSIRARAVALISIAHPKFRRHLLEEARRLNYLPWDSTTVPVSKSTYPKHYEFSRVFKDNSQIVFRPVRSTDARRLQRMFYAMSSEARRLRYHGAIKLLSNETAESLAAIDYDHDMAIVGLVGPRSNPRIIAEGRYMYNPHNNMGEFDIVVLDEYGKRGIGTFLANYLSKIAYSRGLSGVFAEVVGQNSATMKMLKKAWPTAEKHFDSGTCTFTVRFPKEDIERSKDSIIVYSGRFADFAQNGTHHFNPLRARKALQLMKEQGYLNEPWMRIEEPLLLTKQQLVESHHPAFVDALEQANSGEKRDEFAEFHLDEEDSPVFAGLFDYALLYTSATLACVDLIVEQDANVVFNPVGGFSHSSRRHSEGFCYVNDVIAAIDRFLAHGFSVAYVDIDAHHANGVQEAYYSDDRVLFISFHERGRAVDPGTGSVYEIGKQRGEGFTINVPLPPETDDEAYGKAFNRIVPSALKRFAPSVVIMVIGTDCHKADPFSNLCLTNNAMANVVKQVRSHSAHLMLLGGSGYDMNVSARGWCRMWAAANRIHSLPDYMLVMGGSFIGGKGVPGAEIVDMSYRVSGDKKDFILAELDHITAFHEERTLPFIGQHPIRRLNSKHPTAPKVVNLP